MTRHVLAMGVFVALAGCTGAPNDPTGRDSADTDATTDVRAQILLIQAPVRLPKPLANERVLLRPAHVFLDENGNAAYANGIPWTVCDGASALDEATSDENGIFTFSAVAAGQYCVTARDKDFPFNLDGNSPSKMLPPVVLDVNRYGNTCVYTDPYTSQVGSCLTGRDVVGSQCYCQISVKEYASGMVVEDP